ncbi:hypothetical protein P4209_22045 [Pseudomonas aeruginosa]|nr:hypothetical protein [Pseudomonas aeruginosa]
MDDAFSEEGSAQPRHDAQRPALAPRSDGFDIHTYHPDFVADPYPLLRLIRSRAPVCRDQASIWWISRYADVSACLRDRRFSADPARLGATGVRQGGASWFGHQQCNRWRASTTTSCCSTTRRGTPACAGCSLRPSAPTPCAAGKRASRCWWKNSSTACWSAASPICSGISPNR